MLYLLHGWGGDEEEWTNAGYLPEIMDGLVADKKIKPMLVVMPNGHPDEPAAPHVLPVSRRPGELSREGRTAPSAQGDTGINASMLATNFPQLSACGAKQLRLLYFSCGTDDTLIGSNRDVKKWLKEKQINFVDVETPGYAHVWRYWRVSLIDFAPRLFR